MMQEKVNNSAPVYCVTSATGRSDSEFQKLSEAFECCEFTNDRTVRMASFRYLLVRLATEPKLFSTL